MKTVMVEQKDLPVVASRCIKHPNNEAPQMTRSDSPTLQSNAAATVYTGVNTVDVLAGLAKCQERWRICWECFEPQPS